MRDRKRRLRREMVSLLVGAAVLATVVAGLALAPRSAHAWGRPAASGLPLPWDAAGLLSVDRALLEPGGGTIAVRLDLEYRDRPLGGAVDRQLEARIGLHVGILRWLQAGLFVPVSYSDYSLPSAPIANDAANPQPWQAKFGSGDLRVYAKLGAVRTKAVGLAFVTGLVAPTGDTYGFRSDGLWSFEPKMIFDVTGGPFTLALNLGGRFRSGVRRSSGDEPTSILALGSELTWGIATHFQLHRYVAFAVEGAGSEAPLEFKGRQRTVALLGSLWLTPVDGFTFEIGGGHSFVAGAGTTVGDDVGVRADRFRLFAGVMWRPTLGGGSRGVAGDRDGDGVPDETDACPESAEDRDGFEDEDGCPEPDNDGDGVLDSMDRCPTEPEDRDGFHDDDGCPDPDNDGDGIEDVVDRCPDEAEDKDGFEDEDGCPDPDNDGDGIDDTVDRCPNEAETPNGIDDDDGCPDTGSEAASIPEGPPPALQSSASSSTPERAPSRHHRDGSERHRAR